LALGGTVAFLFGSVVFAAEPQAVLTWGRFESAAEVAAWKTLGTTFEPSTKLVTEGASSARLHFRKYAGEPGEDQWPRVTAFATANLYPADWRDWGAVALDVSTDAIETVPFSIEIRDTVGRNGWYAPYTVPPESTVTITIALSDVGRKIDLSHVAEFLLFKGRPEREVDLLLDNVRLIRPEVTDLQAAVEAAAGALAQLWAKQGAGAAQRQALAALRQAAAGPSLSLTEAKGLTEQARALATEIAGLRIKPLRAFDFGPAGSPVRDGFAAVSATAAFDAARGWGWRMTAGLREVTRPAERAWTKTPYLGREVPPAVYLNDLNQDLVAGEGPAEFVIALPAGDYSLWLLAGCAAGFQPMVNDFSVNAGAGDVRISLVQPHIFESRFVPAKAGPEGLVVRFAPETGFVINALAVFAAADAARARLEFAGPLEQEVFLLPPDLWSQWRLVPRGPEKPVEPPSAAETERGYVLFSRPYVRNVYPDSRPQAGERCERLSTFATPGEYEPVTFEVQALRDLGGLAVAAGDLTGLDGKVVPAAAFDVRQVRCWAVRTQYSAFGTYRIAPEVLDPVAPTDLAEGTCRRYWLTVRVPDDASPGVYEGRLALTSAQAPAAAIPVRLEVLPFRLLRDPTKSFGNYYYSPLDRISADMSPPVIAAIRRRAAAEARDMQEHGMNTLQMGGIGARKVNGQWEATVNLDERIAFLQRFGLWGQAPGVMMNAFFADAIYQDCVGVRWSKHLVGMKMPPPEYFEAVTRIVGQVEKERLARGWPEFYYYPIDEAAAEAIPILAATLAAIKQVPTAKTYATQIFELAESRPLDDVLDVWCSGWFCADLAAVEAMRAKGRIFWCYPNFVACSRGVPNSARMTYGFGLWRMGYSCLIPWHYQAPASGSNPFCDFDGTYGDWCMAYPGPEGIPIPTQRWEAVREGIDDGRYLYTLEARIAAAEKAGSAAAAVAAGKALLAEIRAAVPVRSTYDQEGPWTGPEYTTFRRRLADGILALR
jgi:hypothetical protein